ncbi:MAG: hypothetical protein IID32_04770 [Planctomycetes bacterium]|nr:hypothetical protein [Planctomycetota bacterium]
MRCRERFPDRLLFYLFCGRQVLIVRGCVGFRMLIVKMIRVFMVGRGVACAAASE